MQARALLPACALAAALPLLSGCVAAAIPVLAAGGMLRTQVDPGEAHPAATGEPRVPIDISAPATAQHAATTRSYTMADGTRMEVMTGAATQAATADHEPAPAVTTPASVQAAAAVPAGKVYTLADGTRAQIVGTTLPAPGAAAAGASTGDFAGYDPFYAFADSKGIAPVVGAARHSAMLAAPGTLAPETAECSVHPAAVLIDLDPGKDVLDPAVATHADPRLARTLAALRAEGIAVAWLSGNTADQAGALRRALMASDLAPDGRDELALLRYPQERKQTRREDLAKEFCVVAIAGDQRSDFDELFQYLKDPAAAASLEPLIGNGWFLIPQPLS